MSISATQGGHDNGMTAYVCRRFIPTTAFLVIIIVVVI